MQTLNNKLILIVVLFAFGTGAKTRAGPTFGVILLPVRVDTRDMRAAALTHHAPVTLPGVLRHFLERRIQAIGMTTKLAFITE